MAHEVKATKCFKCKQVIAEGAGSEYKDETFHSVECLDKFKAEGLWVEVRVRFGKVNPETDQFESTEHEPKTILQPVCESNFQLFVDDRAPGSTVLTCMRKPGV